MSTWVVIPAAGIGTRMQADRPKQYCMLAGKTLLQHAVNVFSARDDIAKVVVVLHAEDHWWPTLSFLHPEKITTVIGGKERVHSVLLGLTALVDDAAPDDFVLVHDAARPCLSSDAITRLLSTVKDHPVGGLLGLPVVDTLKQVDATDAVTHTVPRTGLWRAQTPQCFRYGLLKPAIETALLQHQQITDESSAMEYAGFQPEMVMGEVANIKITFPEDMILAERMLLNKNQ